jgi:hypothetical protein
MFESPSAAARREQWKGQGALRLAQALRFDRENRPVRFAAYAHPDFRHARLEPQMAGLAVTHVGLLAPAMGATDGLENVTGFSNAAIARSIPKYHQMTSRPIIKAPSSTTTIPTISQSIALHRSRFDQRMADFDRRSPFDG